MDSRRLGIPIFPFKGAPMLLARVQRPPGSFSSVAVHEMGLPRNAKKGGPRDPGEESLEEAIFVYFKGFWPC